MLHQLASIGSYNRMQATRSLYFNDRGKCLFLWSIMATAGQQASGSPEPPSMDIDTPEGSVADTETYPWSEKDQKIIQAYKQYHEDMYYYFVSIERDGPGAAEEPKKPRSDYKSLLGEEKKRSTTLVGQELHNYLVKNCVTGHPVECPKYSAGLITRLADIQEYLKSGYEGLKKTRCATIKAAIDYGEWLNAAYELHYRESQAGEQTASWKEWLEMNVGIGDSYGRKLRAISEVLGKYPRFSNLGLPVSEVYGRRRQIKNLLETDVAAKMYWAAAN